MSWRQLHQRLSYVLSEGYVDIFRSMYPDTIACTHTSKNGGNRLDYVTIAPHAFVVPCAVGIHESSDLPYDHRPVLVDIIGLKLNRVVACRSFGNIKWRSFLDKVRSKVVKHYKRLKNW